MVIFWIGPRRDLYIKKKKTKWLVCSAVLCAMVQ